jgi:hypothetical protein
MCLGDLQEGAAMRLQLRVRDQTTTLKHVFQKAGWRVDSAEGDSLCVSHAGIASEGEARTELDALGLLTSHRVQIEFCPWALSPPEAGSD